MARKRISEYRAKSLLTKELGLPFTSMQVNSSRAYRASSHLETQKYVIKVDQGVKGRFKKGLVLLDQAGSDIQNGIQTLQKKGYSQFIIEEMLSYHKDEEKYLSMTRTRDGYKILYSSHGGIDIEQNQKDIHQLLLPYSYEKNAFSPIAEQLQISEEVFAILVKTCITYYISFLEINPFISRNSSIFILDAAVEVDSTGSFFVHNAWSEEDFADGEHNQRTPEERAIAALAAKSQAAFSLEVLNNDGSIFMMLSGGGASIVLADEVHNQGYGKQLANYGEYSGNPNAEETYIYAKQLLHLLIKSKAEKKVLIIAGGVANFTDVRVTFTGLIKALDEVKSVLREESVSVFVRRGGPYQKEGLTQMEQFLKKEGLLGIVAGPEMVLTDIVTHAIQVI